GEIFGWVVRGGYFFEPSPAPNQPGITNYVDADRHGFSLGTSFSFSDFSSVFPEPLMLDIGGLMIVLHERDYEKLDPADPVGVYSAAGFLFGFATTARFLF